MNRAPWAATGLLGLVAFYALPWSLDGSKSTVFMYGTACLCLTFVGYRLFITSPARQLEARRWLPALLVAGLLLRLAWVAVVPPVQLSDMAEYVTLASQLLRGEGYHQMLGAHPVVAWRAPGYPFLLAAVMTFTSDGDVAAILINQLCYVATALLLYDTTRRLANANAGLLAVALFASWPSGIMSTGLAASEAPSLCLLSLVAWATLRAWSDARPRWWLAAGVAMGFGALVRPSLLPLPAVLLLLGAIDPVRRSARLRHAGLALLVAALCIAPWTWRNMQKLGSPVLVSTNGGDNLYRANNPLATGGFTLAGERSFMHLLPDEVAWNKAQTAAATEWIRAHPMAFLRLGVRKLAISFAEDTTGAYWSLHRAHGMSGPAYRSALIVSNAWWIAVWILALVALARHRWQFAHDPYAALLLWLLLLLPVVHAVYEAQPRYHMPIVGLLLCVAGMVIAPMNRPERPTEPDRVA